MMLQDKCDVKAIVVINPGNPTGQVSISSQFVGKSTREIVSNDIINPQSCSQVLSRANIEMVLKFALEKKLFVFADEVGL